MRYQPGIENLQAAFSDRDVPYITYGSDFASLCATYIPSTLNATRAYIICSTSIANNTDNLRKLTHALEKAGVTVVGTRTGFSPHTRWNQVVSCAEDASDKHADVLITLGAGSLTDGCKVISWMLANDVTTSKGLENMYADAEGYDASALKPPKIKQVAIPTSLSGGEYQSIAGVTRDDGSNRKLLFDPPTCNPALVVLDPELCKSTPERIWLSTGVRAIDHCIETLCSMQSNEKGDAEAEKGLKKLVPSLIRTKKDSNDLDARFESMMGVIEAMSAVGSGVPLGASHAIGHQLGPLGVGHVSFP
jgi:alcohol dehydrogenase class IV